MPAPLEIFVSYSHQDKHLQLKLAEHLRPLEREGLIRYWHDAQIAAGQEFGDVIEERLRAADIVLLLVSPAFVQSEYCWTNEMARALERHNSGKCRVIPVILRPVDWTRAPFRKLLALPEGSKPITDWENLDQGFLSVAIGIRRVVGEFQVVAASAEPITLDPPQVSGSCNQKGAFSAAVAGRLNEILRYFDECPAFGLRPRPTAARVSEALGFESIAALEEMLDGGRPVSFADADRICDLFGIERDWLLNGSGNRFVASQTYSDPGDLLRALVLDQLQWGAGNRYEELVFVLPPGHGSYTCVFGQRDKTGYGVDPLLNRIALYGGTGDTGQRQLFDFCLLSAALGQPWHYSIEVMPRYSYVSPAPDLHAGLVWGDSHLNCCRSRLSASHWLEAIWDFEDSRFHRLYTQAWRDGYEDLKIVAQLDHQITGTEQLLHYLKDRVNRIRALSSTH